MIPIYLFFLITFFKYLFDFTFSINPLITGLNLHLRGIEKAIFIFTFNPSSESFLCFKLSLLWEWKVRGWLLKEMKKGKRKGENEKRKVCFQEKPGISIDRDRSDSIFPQYFYIFLREHVPTFLSFGN